MVAGRELDLCFQNLMLASVKGKVGRTGVAMADWSDLPVELLLKILALVDYRTVVVASTVCTGWRYTISFGLTNLSLSWSKDHINDLVLSLCPKFTKLQVLVLRQNKPQLQDISVEAIANYCHELRELDLGKCLKLSDNSLYALAHGCRNLTRLNISGCSTFSDSALAYLTSFCKHLEYLNLCGCVRAATDGALKAIADNCKRLHTLNLGWCEDVTDKGIVSLATGCPDLRDIDLCGCIRITDESVMALAGGCSRLRSLDLYYCQNITDRAMYSLANSRVRSRCNSWNAVRPCHDEDVGLTSLNISQCTALTPPAVQAVCNSFPALHTCPGRHSLMISGCLSLTSVHCACVVHSNRGGGTTISHHAY